MMASGDTEKIEVLTSNSALNMHPNPKEPPGVYEAGGAGESEDKDNISLANKSISDGKERTGTMAGKSKMDKDKERKIGHRRVGVEGVTYKKIQTSQIMGSIQLGIQHAIGGLASKPERDLLMQDFMTVETTNFPSEGSNLTYAHHYSDFKFKTYAPIAFRYFRDLFSVQPDDFLMSLCDTPLRELSNPGASGSIFYLTSDDEFIIKTVQHKEGEFLQKLLPGYYMNLNQNPRTLLPKFFGLYCYQCNSKNVRLVIMNNLLPSTVQFHQKYDLKGSTYKRKASKDEKSKRSPTYKDLDFLDHHPNGIQMEADTYNALMKTIDRDCRVLESFKIMDYSLLLAIHNLDEYERQKVLELEEIQHTKPENGIADGPSGQFLTAERDIDQRDRAAASHGLDRNKSINRQRLVAHSTAMESIQAEADPIDEDEDTPRGGIPARNGKGERLLLFIGIIDILQSYRLKKKLEHTFKSMIHDGDTVSVHRPSFYANRFKNFMGEKVFKKIESPLKHSPSKRKSLSKPPRHEELDSNTVTSPTDGNIAASKKVSTASQPVTNVSVTTSSVVTSPLNSTPTSVTFPPAAYPAVLVGPTKAKVPPPVPPRGAPKKKGEVVNGKGIACSTPPPTYSEGRDGRSSISGPTSTIITSSTPARGKHHNHHYAQSHHVAVRSVKDDAVSITDIRLESRAKSSLSVESSGGSSVGGGHSSTSGGHSSSRHALEWTLPHSVEGSTPTWTEGTPSFTESSSSGDMGCPTTPHKPGHVKSSKHSRTVENAINCLTTEMMLLLHLSDQSWLIQRLRLPTFTTTRVFVTVTTAIFSMFLYYFVQ